MKETHIPEDDSAREDSILEQYGIGIRAHQYGIWQVVSTWAQVTRWKTGHWTGVLSSENL